MKTLTATTIRRRTKPGDWMRDQARGRAPALEKETGLRLRIQLDEDERRLGFRDLRDLILAEARRQPGAARFRLHTVSARGFHRQPWPEVIEVEIEE